MCNSRYFARFQWLCCFPLASAHAGTIRSLQRWHMMFSCGTEDRCRRAGAGMFRGWCIDLRDRNCPAARIAWGYEVVLGHGSDGDDDVSMNAESLTLP